MTYVPKDHWMICDRCGGKYRRSEMREEWTGLWVCNRGCWEPRHPQDFVEGVEDNMTVDVSRPDVESGIMGTTSLSFAMVKYSKNAALTSATGLTAGDPIGILMDDGIIHWAAITVRVAHLVVLNDGITCAASAGNKVYLPSLDNENWV